MCIRDRSRLALDVYALSARTRSGRVRGRPRPPVDTVMVSSTASKNDVSAACPAVRTSPSGRPLPSAARWILQVIPPRDLSLIHISEPTRRTPISYAVFCLKKKTRPQLIHKQKPYVTEL